MEDPTEGEEVMALKYICDNCGRRADSTNGWATARERSTYDEQGNTTVPEKEWDLCPTCWYKAKNNLSLLKRE